MNAGLIIMIIISILVLILTMGLVIYRKKRDNPTYFLKQWDDLQKLCATKEAWVAVIIDADNLLDRALKKCSKGKTMGERLVHVQRNLTDNDGVWYAHNLAKKLKADVSKKPRQQEVKKSLLGIRRALNDLGMMDA